MQSARILDQLRERIRYLPKSLRPVEPAFDALAVFGLGRRIAFCDQHVDVWKRIEPPWMIELACDRIDERAWRNNWHCADAPPVVGAVFTVCCNECTVAPSLGFGPVPAGPSWGPFQHNRILPTPMMRSTRSHHGDVRPARQIFPITSKMIRMSTTRPIPPLGP